MSNKRVVPMNVKYAWAQAMTSMLAAAGANKTAKSWWQLVN